MDVKKFLRQIRKEQTELELLLLKRESIVVIHGMTYDRDKVVTSNDSDLSELAIKNGELLNSIDAKIQMFNDHQHLAMNLIFQLSENVQRQIMLMYYLSRKPQKNSRLTAPYSLEEVAVSLNFSFDYVRHIHGEALNILRKNFEKKALA